MTEATVEIGAILSEEIANLGYPVGMGMAPSPEFIERVEQRIIRTFSTTLAAPPVPVTVTEEMVERAAKILPHVWPGGFEDQEELPLAFRPNDHARAVARNLLTAALAASIPAETTSGKRWLKDETTEWRVDVGDDRTATCHSRMIDGVLCRWWGDGEPPAGVAAIDAAAFSSP